jgi:renal tumor antigen
MKVDEWAVGCILFEILTGRPLFPGRSEIDQIAKIHSLLGTPSKKLLKQFRAQQNIQISYAFPEIPGVDIAQMIPNAGLMTIDLIKKLLIYDPEDRISAEDALQHHSFAFLRRSEERWNQTDQSTPFPLFALSEAAAQMRPPVEYQPRPPPGKPTRRRAVQPPDPALKEARMRAAQRIREYNQKIATLQRNVD